MQKRGQFSSMSKEGLVIEIVYIQMSQQNYTEAGRFTVEREAKRGPISSSYSYRLAQLESKVCFYEGQVDPLLTDNASLRQSLIELFRVISVSSEKLRRLIGASDAGTKLKLGLSNLQQTVGMVAREWDSLHQQIKDKQALIEGLKDKISQLQSKHQQEIKVHKNQLRVLDQEKEKLMNTFNSQIFALNSQIDRIKTEKEQQAKRLEAELVACSDTIESMAKEKQVLKESIKLKCREYEGKIKQLNERIQRNVIEFEEGKKRVKGLCQKLMNDKVAETTELYEYMLKSKEQEKMALALSKDQSEQSLRNQIHLKEESLKRYLGVIDKHKMEISQLNERVQLIDQELLEQKNKSKGLQKEVLQASERISELADKLGQKQRELEGQGLKLQQTMLNFQQELVNRTEQMQIKLRQTLEEKERLNATIQQKQQKILQVKKTAVECQRQWQQKVEKLQKEWTQKEKELNQQIVAKNFELQEESLKVKAAKQNQEKMIFELKAAHLDELQAKETGFRMYQAELKKEHEKVVKTGSEAKQQQFITMKVDFDATITALKLNNSKKLEQLNSEHVSQLSELTVKYTAEKEQLQNKLSAAQTAEVQMRQRLLKIEKRLSNHQKQIQDVRIEFIKKIKRIQELNQGQKKRLNETIEQQMIDFQKELEEQVNTMCNMQAEMQLQVDSLKEMKGISEVEQNCQKQIEEIKNKFAEDSKKLQLKFKSNLQNIGESHRQQLKQVETAYQYLAVQTREQFNSKIREMQSNFKKILIQLIQNTEGKQGGKEARIQFGIQNGNLRGVELQTLQQYVFGCVQRLWKRISQLEGQKDFLQEKLNMKERMLDEIQRKDDQFIQDKLRNRREEYQLLKRQLIAKMEKITADCNREIERVHRERIEFTQNLHAEFGRLKLQHQSKYNFLAKKYRELQQLFEERPSREEDVSRIKDLMSLKEKMDIQVQTYQKKVQTANEIVKYMNLQLQNYKDTFAIFGVNAGSDIGEAVKSKITSSPIEKYTNQKKKISQTSDLLKCKDEFQSMVRQVSLKYQPNQSPMLKELNVFGEAKLNDSFMQDEDQTLERRERGLSLSLRKDKIKTQKIEEKQKGSEMLTHTQKFIKLLKVGEQKRQSNDILSKQRQSNRLKKNPTYRRRKVCKRVTTNQSQHFY